MALPSTYTPLTYIESSGTQYIDTGIAPSDYLLSLKIEADMSYTSVPTGSSTQSYLFGTGIYASTAGNRKNVLCGYRGAKSTSLFVYLNDGQLSNAVTFTGATLDTNRHIFTIDQVNSVYGFDGDTLSFGSTNQSTNTNSLLIFCARQTSSSGAPIGYYSSARLYSFKIYNNGTLIRDFQPCARVSDGTIGLYDLVNDVFYENQGTGDFTPSETIVHCFITASPSSSGTCTGTGYYAIGTQATFTATPNEGYYFVGGRVRMNGQDIATMLTTPWTYTIPGLISIQAYFMPGPTVSVTIDPAGVGTVSGGGSYAPGSIVSLSATPTDVGYLFDHFTIDGTDYSDNPHMLVVSSADVSVVAHFRQREYIESKTSWNESEYLNIGDLNRIENNLYVLATLYGTTPNLKVWQYGDIPTNQQFARILGLCEDIFSVTHHGYIPAYPINEAIKIQELERFIQQNYDAYYE